MPDSCCTVGFTNRRNDNNQLEYYRNPMERGEDMRNKQWMQAIKQDNWSHTKIVNSVCVSHFFHI